MPITESWRLADIRVENTDQRRKLARKYARVVNPDATSSLAGLLTDPLDLSDVTTHASGATITARPAQVLVPLVDPLIVAFGRLLPLADRSGNDAPNPQLLPQPRIDDHGNLTATWADRDHLYRAFHIAYAHAHRTVGETIDAIDNRAFYNGLDSWHSPLLVAPITHQFADGDYPTTRWMTLDGSSRIWALRQVLAARTPWMSQTPYARIADDWNNHPAIAWRLFLSAVRRHEEREVERDHLPTSLVTDWATLVLAPPQASTHPWNDELEIALFNEHRGPRSA